MKTKSKYWLGWMLLLAVSSFSAQAFYNPEPGRWLSRDPITERGGLNLYAMVFNRPNMEVDADGRSLPFPCPGNLPCSPPPGLPPGPPAWIRSLCVSCNGRAYDRKTHCCCNKDGKEQLLERKKVPTGIKICTAESLNYGGIEHQWIEIDGWSAGFSCKVGVAGQGEVHIPDPYNTRTDKQCTDVLLSPCAIDFEALRDSIKAGAEADLKNPPPYCVGFCDCRQWSVYLVYGLIEKLAGKGCGL